MLLTSVVEMSSMEEVITVVCLYMVVCIIFSVIYVLTGSEKLALDVILKLNETGNLSLSM